MTLLCRTVTPPNSTDVNLYQSGRESTYLIFFVEFVIVACISKPILVVLLALVAQSGWKALSRHSGSYVGVT